MSNGLVLYLDVGNQKSYSGTGSTWYDVSGNGNNGIISGSPQYNSGSFVLSNNSQYITTSQYLVPNGGVTFNTFVYTTSASFPTNDAAGVIGYRNSSNILSMGLNGTGGLPFFYIEAGLPAFTLALPSSFNYNTWCNLGVTVQNSNFNFYYNGTFVGNNTTSYTLPANIPSGALIGKWVGGNVVSLSGNISIAQVYNRALSSQEISQNYNSLKTRFGLK